MTTETAERLTQEAFNTFAKLHPREAMELDPERFCDLFRKLIGEYIDNETIIEFMKEETK